MQRPSDRGVRRNGPREVFPNAKVSDVEEAFAATGQHQCRLHEDLASIMQCDTVGTPRNRSRQRLWKTEMISETPQSVETDMRNDAFSATFDLERASAGRVHFGSALLLRETDGVTNTVYPVQKGLSTSLG